MYTTPLVGISRIATSGATSSAFQGMALRAALLALPLQLAATQLQSRDDTLPADWVLAPEADNVGGRAHAGADFGDIRFLGAFTSWSACVGAWAPEFGGRTFGF